MTHALARVRSFSVGAFEWARWDRPLLVGNVVALVVGLAVMTFASNGYGWDARGMWQINPFQPYWTPDYGTTGAYFYSPAFALLVWPFGFVSYTVFVGILFAVDFTALGWLVGWRWIGYALLLAPVMDDLKGPNIDIPLAAAVVLALERPALWAFVFLTKVTPGIGVLWFAVRREWRSFFIALGVTAAIVAVSFAITPDAWFRWIALLADNGARPAPDLALPVPLAIRLPIAALLVVVAARTNRPWLVSVAAFLAVAIIWREHYVLLLGVVAAGRLGRRRATMATDPGTATASARDAAPDPPRPSFEPAARS